MVCKLLFGICCSWFIVFCLIVGVCCLLSGVGRSSVVVCRLRLCRVRCVLLVVAGWLLVVGCLLCVGCCLCLAV